MRQGSRIGRGGAEADHQGLEEAWNTLTNGEGFSDRNEQVTGEFPLDKRLFISLEIFSH